MAHSAFAELNDEMALNGVTCQEDSVLPFSIASCMLLFTPNALFGGYQLLQGHSSLWRSVPTHCSTAKWVCFITWSSTA